MKDKIRLSVPFTKKTYDLIALRSDELGMSMSSYVQHLVAQSMSTQEKLMTQLSKVLDEGLTQALTQHLQDAQKDIEE